MLGRILMNKRSEYPGYKVKKGMLCSGNSITKEMLSGRIPLSVEFTCSSYNGTVAYNPTIITNIGSQQVARIHSSGNYINGITSGAIYDLESIFKDRFMEISNISMDSGTASKNGNFVIVKWLEKSGGGVLNPLIKNGVAYLKKVVSNMLGRVHMSNKSEYVGYKIMRGAKDVVSASNDGIISILISQGIIPLTFRLEWSGTTKWYIHFAMQSTPIGHQNGFIWSGGGKETCVAYMDVESLYGLEYLKKCKYFGGNATNSTGTYKITIVKWLEKVGG